MDILVQNIPTTARQHEVKTAIAVVLHDENYVVQQDRPLNFDLILNPGPTVLESRNDGTGHLIIPDLKVAQNFLQVVSAKDSQDVVSVIITVRDYIDGEKKRKLRFRRCGTPSKLKVQVLLQAPFIDPNVEEEHRYRQAALEGSRIELERIQIGIWKNKSLPDLFSIEWERDAKYRRAGLLNMDYDRKLVQIQLGDPVTEEIDHRIVLKFSNIRRMFKGVDMGNTYLCFHLSAPPTLEKEYFNRTITGQAEQDSRKFRERCGWLDPSHQIVAPYAFQVRVVLFREKDLEEFETLCTLAELRRPLATRRPIDARSMKLFSQKTSWIIERWLRSLGFKVAFQVEALLRNALLDTEEILTLRGPIDDFCKQDASRTASALLSLHESLLSDRSPNVHVVDLFRRVWNSGSKRKEVVPSIGSGLFMCYHVTFTPTRTMLEGPYPTQSNRVIRQYFQNQDRFIRVDFRDEDKLQYRWDREVDGLSFLQLRVGQVLEHGFTLAGREFEFLAYSQSALREHAVWFVCPFQDAKTGHTINAAVIRQGLGDFSGVIKIPSKYAARMAQAFTATDPSVKISRDQWCEIPDLGEAPYEFTDGVGSISPQLADMIWTELSESRSDLGQVTPKPTAFQIRFLGYKGMVAVDPELKGIKMCLRPSMNKFRAHESDAENEAMIEIARAFDRPGTAYLNRTLVTILEDRLVKKEKFIDLQNHAIAAVKTSMTSVRSFCKILSQHNLGEKFRLRFVLNKLSCLGLDFEGQSAQLRLPFLNSLGRYAMNHVLRDIKHRARIPIPNSYSLVGVADEGPAYENSGRQNVYCIPEGEIRVCIQGPDDPEPIWLNGNCVVTRSPTVHPGDVQNAYAGGKPPDDQLCSFRNLRNVVVFSSKGTRSLPSMLGGGDLDGDLYDVIKYPALYPTLISLPAAYTPVVPKEKEEDSTIKDVCDFVVEYIYSDVLGLLATNHLIIADQSKDGVFDERCIKLAELCSQAVEYPKSGQRVDIKKAPRIGRYKPDWQNAEIQAPRETDYYLSTRALGELYRNIHLLDGPEEQFRPLPDLSARNSARAPLHQQLALGYPPGIPISGSMSPERSQSMRPLQPPPVPSDTWTSATLPPESIASLSTTGAQAPKTSAKHAKQRTRTLLSTGLPSRALTRAPSITRALDRSVAGASANRFEGGMPMSSTVVIPVLKPPIGPSAKAPLSKPPISSVPMTPPGIPVPTHAPGLPNPQIFSNVTTAVRDHVRARMDLPDTDDLSSTIRDLFMEYQGELRYVCTMHSLSNHADDRSPNRLEEEEIVVGTILAKCSQHRHRADRTYRMRLHSGELVSRIKDALMPNRKDLRASMPALQDGLKKAWEAWGLSIRNEGWFGAGSFGLIALGVIFDLVDALDSMG